MCIFFADHFFKSMTSNMVKSFEKVKMIHFTVKVRN